MVQGRVAKESEATFVVTFYFRNKSMDSALGATFWPVYNVLCANLQHLCVILSSSDYTINQTNCAPMSTEREQRNAQSRGHSGTASVPNLKLCHKKTFTRAIQVNSSQVIFRSFLHCSPFYRLHCSTVRVE